MQVYLRELARLRDLDARVVLPAHGDAIDDPAEIFTRYIAHRTMREARVLGAVGARPRSTPEELVPDAYADTPPGTWPLALLSLRAHLVKLEREGRVAQSEGRFTALS
jgi:glyoxylase-like metal-dependent hydrolase (beta-lactamase superfamily II)